MLSVKRLQNVLQNTLLTDNIDGIVLMTIEGSILSSAHIKDGKTESKVTLLAAVSSSVFSNLQTNNNSKLYSTYISYSITLLIL